MIATLHSFATVVTFVVTTAVTAGTVLLSRSRQR
jgi:hypothetical protein